MHEQQHHLRFAQRDRIALRATISGGSNGESILHREVRSARLEQHIAIAPVPPSILSLAHFLCIRHTHTYGIESHFIDDRRTLHCALSCAEACAPPPLRAPASTARVCAAILFLLS
jgi:hypothetical protein